MNAYDHDRNNVNSHSCQEDINPHETRFKNIIVIILGILRESLASPTGILWKVQGSQEHRRSRHRRRVPHDRTHDDDDDDDDDNT